MAIEFGRRGYRLELAGRRTDALEATLLKAGSPGDFRGLDVTRDSAIREWARDRIERLGAPAIVVPAAGSGRIGAAEGTTGAELSAMLAVNLVGAADTIQAFLPAMRAAGSGLIVALLSVAARRSFAGWSAYGASKAGLAAYLQALRLELAGSGVRILEVYPGATDTPIWDALPGSWDRGAMMKSPEVASAVVACALAGASVTVEELHLGPAGGALSG